MKTLCVVPSYYPAFQYGGPITSAHEINRALVRKGIDVTVYTTNAGLNGRVPANEKVYVDGIRVFYFTITKPLEYLGPTGWQFSLPMTKALRDNLKDFDLVYMIAVWNYPISVSAYYCRRYKKPYIISPRGLLDPYTIRKKFWKKFLYYHLVSKRDLRAASAIHYASGAEAGRCHSFLRLRNKAVVVPNGIDISEFASKSEIEKLRDRYPYLKDKQVLLFLGRLHWIKGLDILIKAYSQLARERDDVHLLIAGGDDEGYGEKVKRWIRDYGMDYVDFVSTGRALGNNTEDIAVNGNIRVTFTGMLAGGEKLKALFESDIFILPSYSESFGMAVVEAMACGIPVVVSTQVGICAEIERFRAGIVVETNAESLYEGISTLLEDRRLRQEAVMNARKLVREHYDIDGVADRMITVFQEVIGGLR